MAWWTALEALEFIALLWPVWLVWAIVIVIAASALVRRHHGLLRHVAWALLPFGFSAAIIFCGVAFHNPNGAHGAGSPYATALIWALFAGQVIASVWLIRRSRVAKVFTAVVAAGALWLSLWGGFISLMSVTGNWL